MAKRSDVVVARVSAVLHLNGQRHKIHRGRTTAHMNHPIVKGREHMWRPITVDYAVDDDSSVEEPKKPRTYRKKKDEDESPATPNVNPLKINVEESDSHDEAKDKDAEDK